MKIDFINIGILVAVAFIGYLWYQKFKKKKEESNTNRFPIDKEGYVDLSKRGDRK